jgi:hypothetical protein
MPSSHQSYLSGRRECEYTSRYDHLDQFCDEELMEQVLTPSSSAKPIHHKTFEIQLYEQPSFPKTEVIFITILEQIRNAPIDRASEIGYPMIKEQSSAIKAVVEIEITSFLKGTGSV